MGAYTLFPENPDSETRMAAERDEQTTTDTPMTSDTGLPPAVINDEDKTGAGNYFVANYPPFSCWTPQHVNDVHDVLKRTPANAAEMGVYVHIPFCRKRCHFCYFRVYTDRNAAQIQDYMSAVIREASLYAQSPYLRGRRPRFVYFGGGTPSYLSAEQLRTLTEGLRQHMSWDDAEEITFECEPGTLNRKKLEAIRDFGVTRLSLGIENFDDEILANNNRAHLSKQVYAAYEDARSTGFAQINIDLIAGMIGETPANWQQCVDRTIDLAPDSITIYQMEVPYNTTIYKQMRADGRVTAPVADWATKRQWVADAFARLETAGYTVASAYTAVRRREHSRFLYRDALWTGADMIGLGVASFSHLDGTHYQNETGSEIYEQRLGRDELPVCRAMTMTPTEQLIRQFILQLKLGRVERGFFHERFGIDVCEKFAGELGRLRHAGYLTFDEQTITLSREGLLRVDRLLHNFFLPEHREVPYA